MTLVKTSKGLIPSVLSDFFDNDKFLTNPWFEKEFEQTLPAVNIKETEKEFNIEFAAPGFQKNDFKISLEENILTISAEKKEENKEEKEKYTRKEFYYKTFSRSFTLPQTVLPDKTDAKYADGILYILIPKKETENMNTKKEIKIA